MSASHQVNQAPAFADTANGDFHEAAGAPSIDTGTDNSANGSIDIDGDPRQLGTHTDLGAYEFVPAPTASVAPATDLSTGGATLHGSLNDGGIPGSLHFLYGTSAGSLTSSTPTQSVPAGAASQSVSAPLTGLNPGTTYFYALVVSTTGGTVTSAERLVHHLRHHPPVDRDHRSGRRRHLHHWRSGSCCLHLHGSLRRAGSRPAAGPSPPGAEHRLPRPVGPTPSRSRPLTMRVIRRRALSATP